MTKLAMLCETCGHDLPHSNDGCGPCNMTRDGACSKQAMLRARLAATRDPGYAQASKARKEESCAATAAPSPTSTPSPATSVPSPTRTSRARTTSPPAVDVASILAALRRSQNVSEPSVPSPPIQVPPAPAIAPEEPTVAPSTNPAPKRTARQLTLSLSGTPADVKTAWDDMVRLLKPDHIVVSRGKIGPQTDRYDDTLSTVRYNVFVWDAK